MVLMKLKNWIPHVGGKQAPEDQYVDSAEVPPLPEGPYRARMVEATHRRAPEGIDVKEREVVTGRLELLFRISCPCGHQWATLKFQQVTLCTQCGSAVLVDPPKLPTE